MVTAGYLDGEDFDRNNEIGGNATDRGRSPSVRSSGFSSSLSLIEGARFRCDSQMEATSSKETAREEPEFPIASKVRSAECTVDFWEVIVECNTVTWASRVTTRL